jgi:ABC-type uncharacterized transport system permease subunit
MNKTSTNKKRLILRIYDWPLSYFVGLLIGLVVTSLFGIFSSDIRSNFEPIGINLFLLGWILIIASSFGHGIEKIITIDPPTKTQQVIRRGSVIAGIALSAAACTFFMQPDKLREENKSEQATPRKPSD